MHVLKLIKEGDGAVLTAIRSVIVLTVFVLAYSPVFLAGLFVGFLIWGQTSP